MGPKFKSNQHNEVGWLPKWDSKHYMGGRLGNIFHESLGNFISRRFCSHAWDRQWELFDRGAPQLVGDVCLAAGPQWNTGNGGRKESKSTQKLPEQANNTRVVQHVKMNLRRLDQPKWQALAKQPQGANVT